MRIAVFGAGGVGAYFGGRLAQAGEDVVFIARGEHLRVIRERGLRVDSVSGDFHLPSVQAASEPGEVGVVDLVLVCVKAWQLGDAAEQMCPLVGQETSVLPLSNGVEAPVVLGRVLGKERVLGGLCALISFVAGPGHIRHTAVAPFVKFGELDNSPSRRSERIRAVFARARGVDVEIPADIHTAMWLKFLFIVACSGLGAITRCPVGIFRTQPETRRLLEQVLEEVYEVGRARDVALPADSVARTMDVVDGLAETATMSMQRDIMEGRPSELEDQTGAVVRLGQRAGVQTPANAFIYGSLLPMELRARGRISF